MLGVIDIAGVDIGADPDEDVIPVLGFRTQLAGGYEPEIIFFASIASKRIDAAGPDLDTEGSISSLAIGEESEELAGGGSQEFLLLSDGDWCGRPDDFGAAHAEAIPILVDAGDIRIEIPYLPEADRRAATLVASIEAANDDAAYDLWPFERSVDGQEIVIEAGGRDGYSADRLLVARARGRSVRASPTRLTIELENAADLLDTPALRQKYAGNGGSTGDPNLAGKYLPLALGDCRNIAPDLERYALQIYRFSAGASSDVLAVRDRMVPLSWDGVDHADFTSLANASVAPGFYTKATAISRFRLGAPPAGIVTADVWGSTLFGNYSAASGDILSFLQRGVAGLPDVLLNLGTLGVLPRYPIGIYLDGSQLFSVAALHNAILRPFNAHYGPLRDGRIGVGVVNADNFATALWRLEGDNLSDIDPDEFDEPPRWRQSLSWGRNWKLMSAADIALENPAVTPEIAAFAQRETVLATAEDSSIRLRHTGALDGDTADGYGPIESYFVNAPDALAAAQKLHEYLALRKVIYRVPADMRLLDMFPGQGGVVTAGRCGLDTPRASFGVTREVSARRRGVSLTAITAIDLEAA